ncbi:MAG: hypothetical protein DMG63_00200 [Acidobacteria bacterium]|nr:MAG: hypothetical protein DMG63_00200 [Acidobacteriota bacterium]
MKKQRRHLNVVLRPEPEGGFTAVVPALPGYVTCGRTLARARTMAKDTMTGYIESLKKRNEPVPGDEETLVTSLDLEYAEAARDKPGAVITFLEQDGVTLDHVSGSPHIL